MDEESDAERRQPSTSNAPSFGRKIGATLRGIPNWINIGAGLIAGGTAIWLWVVPLVWGPDVSFTASCKNHRILIEIQNKGGRTARVGPPVFTIHSPIRNKTLDLSRYLVGDDEDGQVNIAPNQPGSLKYEHSLNFFGERESANNACSFALTLPVEGEQSVPGTCSCVYSASDL